MNKLKYRNIVFDCDSTLTKIEGLDFIAEYKGLLNEVRKITESGMNGDLPFSLSLKRRLELIKVTRRDIQVLADAYVANVVGDALVTIKKLTNMGHRIHILTGALLPATGKLSEFLEVSSRCVTAVPATRSPGGYLVVEDKMLHSIDNLKKDKLREIKATGKTVLVGDGVTDLEAGAAADLFIGFGGVVKRSRVYENSPNYIYECKLSRVLDFVL